MTSRRDRSMQWNAAVDPQSIRISSTSTERTVPLLMNRFDQINDCSKRMLPIKQTIRVT